MRKSNYGQKTPDIGERTFGLGWLAGVRHIDFHTAGVSHWHAHAELSMIFCLRGEFSYEFRDRGPVTLSAGSYLAFPRNVVHRHEQAIDPVGRRLELLLTPERCAKGRFGIIPPSALRNCIRSIFAPPTAPKSCSRAVLNDIRELAELAARGERRLTPVDAARVRLLASAAILGCGEGGATPTVTSAEPVQMDEILAWMEQHLPEKISIARLVARIGYSRTHVFTLFRERTGLTPTDYLTRLRIRKARELLKSTDLSAQEIATACGFSSPTVFSTAFKRQTGFSPISWRAASAS